MKLKVTCDFDFTLFPYDSQACPVVFRIPFFNLREVSFRAAPTDVSLSWYPDRYNSGYNRDRMKEKTLSAGWEVINVTGGIQYLKWYQQKVSYVQTIPDEHDLGSAWPFFVFRVRLKRFQSYVGMLLMMPFVFTSLLTLISFFITDYSTVVLVVVSNLILQALYLLELLKVTPLSSGTVPGVGKSN